MRGGIFITVILILLSINLSCLKEEIPSPIVKYESSYDGIVVLDDVKILGPRSEDDVIFFLESISTDNYTSHPNIGRTHTAYAARTIAYVQLDIGLTIEKVIQRCEILISGATICTNTKMKHYKVMLRYKDSITIPPTLFTAFSKDRGDHVKHIPTSDGAIKPHSPLLREVKWVRDSTTVSNYNDFKGSNQLLANWNIYNNGVFYIKKMKEAASNNSAQFQLDHRF